MLSVRYLLPVPSVGVPDGGFRSGERADGRVPYRRTDCPLRAVRFSFSCCPGLAGSADSPGKFGGPGADRGLARVRQGAGGEVGQADGRGRFFRRRRYGACRGAASGKEAVPDSGAAALRRKGPGGLRIREGLRRASDGGGIRNPGRVGTETGAKKGIGLPH